MQHTRLSTLVESISLDKIRHLVYFSQSNGRRTDLKRHSWAGLQPLTMYIGPWQEYRLAKIQDDAIQRIRKEWEASIRAQLPDDGENHHRVDELMAKLPALLLGAKGSSSRKSETRKATRPSEAASASNRQVSRPTTAVSTASSSTRSTREETPKSRRKPQSQNNQDSHEADHQATNPVRKSTAKKKTRIAKAQPLTSLGEVEKRKRMFATWMKSSASAAQDDSSSQRETARLPPIQQDRPQLSPEPEDIPPHEPVRFPPLFASHREQIDASESRTPVYTAEPNLDDSLDEDEVNQLLDWTDNLLSPSALEASLDGVDELG